MISFLHLFVACCSFSSMVTSPSFLTGVKLQLASANPAPPPYNITFYANPAVYYNWVIFNGTIYQDGHSDNFTAGNYTARANVYACPSLRTVCYEFDHWNRTGGVSVMQPLHNPSNVTVTGSGSLTANYRQYPKSIEPSTILIALSTTLIAVGVLRRRASNSGLR